MRHLDCELAYSCLVVVLMLTSFSAEDASECSKIRCFNNGTPITTNMSCSCQCQPNFSGLLCEVEMMPSAWPDGPYALLMPWTGCPESEAHGWGQGYINFTTVNPVAIFMEFQNASDVDIRPVLSHHDIKLSKFFLNYSLQINFCFKHAVTSASNIADWPVSPISVFGPEDGCPAGFSDFTLEIALPVTSSWRTDGYLPYFKVLNTETGTKIITKNCRSTEWSELTTEKKSNSFILVQSEDNCSTASVTFTTEVYTVVICDSNTNSTVTEQCSKLQFCAYNPVPEKEEPISNWPNIPFAMLFPKSGCPNYVDWSMGYIRFKTLPYVVWAYYDTPSMGESGNETEKSIDETFHLHFCLKKEVQQFHEARDWPRGDYTIFRIQDTCPDGFTPERISIELPLISDWYVYGELPRFEMHRNGTDIVIEACRHNIGHNIQVPFNKDHIFLSAKPAFSNHLSSIRNTSYEEQGSTYQYTQFESESDGSHCTAFSEDGFQISWLDIVATSDVDIYFGPRKEYILIVCECIPPIKATAYCNEGYFYCGYGQCIYPGNVCNGYRTCPSGNDELEDNCIPKCPFPELHCDHDLCIPRIWLCDGFQHCYDGFDEMESNCYRNNITDEGCFDGEFECDGKCLPVLWICDGINDCADGSDEESDNCELKCRKDEIGCDYGNCIPVERVCNGFEDCIDGTDEMDCSMRCDKNEFYCASKRCSPRSRVCDGFEDCIDGTDEIDCSMMCTQDEFFCGISMDYSNKPCIMKNKVCDGYPDCPDSRDEDEAYCSYTMKLFCQNELGLTDGSVEDGQFSASSWEDSNLPEMARPFSRSWCPLVTDNNPFLQIDLLSISLIKGFTLFNYVKRTVPENKIPVVPILEMIGCRSFRVSYGIFQDSFKYYHDMPFEVDVSQHVEWPRRVMLLRPFLSRFVRFHPLSPIADGKLCLQLELIGCSATAVDTHQEVIIKPETVHGANAEMYNYKVITSDGHPLQYTSNKEFTWNITTHHTGYLRFTFEVIDLHNTLILPSSWCSEDTIMFSEDFEPITSRHNGLTPTFPTASRRGYIVFRTCTRKYRNDERRKGFRLILKREEAPTVWRYITKDIVFQGRLLTNSLLGLITLPATQNWTLQSGSDAGPLNVSIQYFNFPANSGNSLRMKVGIYSKFEVFTNENKPRKEVIDWNIWIEAYFEEKVTLPFPQGFTAMYRIVSAPRYDHLVEFEETALESSERDVLDMQKVCSKDLKKCYFLQIGAYYNDWFTEYRFCHRFGRTLINIHSRRENNFLQSWLWYKLRDFRYSGRAREFMMERPFKQFYIHIGLLRNTTYTGLSEIWTDGSKLSFTNWDKDQPNDPTLHQCTGLKIGRTLDETKWVTSACQEPESVGEQYYLGSACETSFNKFVAGESLIINMTETVESTGTNTDSLSTTLFRCCSSEYVTQLAVCDGIPDCIDGSDEDKCELKKKNPIWFTCSNGEHVTFGKVCNYKFDCSDGSDEFCKYPACGQRDFTCDNGQCIPAYLKCDAQRDCIDGSDEMLCGICNASVAFACDDLTCIHKSLVCNKIPECSDGEDEINCNLQFSSCYEHWKSGYDQDFTISHPEYGFGKCSVQSAKRDTIAISTTFDISKSLDRYFWPFLIAIRLNITHFLEHGQLCQGQISAICQLPVAEIEEYNRLFSNGIVNKCNHRLRTYSFRPKEPFRYNAEPEILSVYVPTESVTSIIKASPLECITEHNVSLDAIRCGDGTNVPAYHKCLYNVNRVGVIDSCQTFKHLEDCETFVCPLNYAKCPSSFCVAHQLICDGERNCPGGEDENGCGCKQRNATVVFIYDQSMARDRQSLLFKFARQFHSDNARSIAVSYLRKTLSLFDSNYTISTQDIHPYSEILSLNSSQTVETGCCLADEIFKYIDNSASIFVFNIEHDHDLSNHLSETIGNNSLVSYLYNIRVRSSIRQRVVVKNSSREAEVIFKSWKIFGNVMRNLFPDICLEMISTNCIGQYRCSSSRICIPLSHICDGEKQCPFEDDEIACDIRCPKTCSCKMYVADCRLSNFTDSDLHTLASTMRVLDMSQNTVFSNNVFTLQKAWPFLIQLNVSRCTLHSITVKTFRNTPNLLQLDLSFNQIAIIKTETFSGLVKLQSIDLTGNPTLKHIEPYAFQMLMKLSKLSIIQTELFEIQANTFSGLILKTLDISNNNIHTLHGRAFNNLSVEEIIFVDNDVQSYNDQVFAGIRNVKIIWAPAFKFCCSKPDFLNEESCFPTKDEFSSCDDLMRNSILQTLLWIIGAVSLVGNISTLIYRLAYDRAKIKSGYGMFVTHLAASDLLMGVYMITIAIADLAFRKRYIEMDEFWRNSAWCKLAGVLATVSSETSVLLMCLITVDRLLVIKFPFGQWRFRTVSSRVAVFSSWFIAWTLAVFPLIVDSYFKDAFYSQSGVCNALPLSRKRIPGWLYSFLINIALNFVAFILIAIGQLFMYLEIRKTSRRMKNIRSQRRNDIGITKNLLLVVATDFICWFPIGIMGILAYDGYEISGDVYAWTAVLILPINSALNPFLYTLASLRNPKVVGNTKDDRKDIRAPDRPARQ